MLSQKRLSIDREIQISWWRRNAALRASLTAFTRKGRSRGKGEWKRRGEEEQPRGSVYRTMWILCESNSFESPMRAELARAPSSLVPRDRFEINQRFRAVDLPPTSLSSPPTHVKDPQLPARLVHCPIFNQELRISSIQSRDTCLIRSWHYARAVLGFPR